jgi:hypothetical protein
MSRQPLLLCFVTLLIFGEEYKLWDQWRYSSTHSLTSALDGSECSASRPGRFTPRERASGTHWVGGWVGLRAVLDAVVKRKIPSPHQESNPRNLMVQSVAQRYTDWAITGLFCIYGATHTWMVEYHDQGHFCWEDAVSGKTFTSPTHHLFHGTSKTLVSKYDMYTRSSVANLRDILPLKWFDLHTKASKYYTLRMIPYRYQFLYIISISMYSDIVKSVRHNLKVSYSLHDRKCLHVKNISYTICKLVYYPSPYRISHAQLQWFIS